MEKLHNTKKTPLTLNRFQALDLNVFLLHELCIESVKII